MQVEADTPVRRQNERVDRSSPMRPLRRRPKKLDAEPTLFEPTVGGNGGVLLIAQGAHRDQRGAGRQPASSAPGLTDETGVLLGADRAGLGADPETLRRARQIAARVAIPRARRDFTTRRGSGKLVSVPYRGGSDDIDLDATLDRLVEHPVPDDDDIIVRDRIRTRRS